LDAIAFGGGRDYFFNQFLIIMSKFRDLPIEQLECDPNQPRKDFGTEGDTNALMRDINESGIDVPLAVLVISPNRYLILDGHRRYKCAQRLGLKDVPCRVYENLSPAEIERKRYNIQNNRRPWRPLERSNAIERIKEAAGLKTYSEIARFLGLSVSLVNCSLRLRSQKMEYIEMMERYNLAQSYRDEFLKLRPKIHKVKNFEVDEIIKIIFQKIENQKITSAKEIRVLKRIFNRDSVNENALEKFLSDPDMGIMGLIDHTVQNGFSLHIDQLIKEIAERINKNNNGYDFTPQERPVLIQLRDLLVKILK
jgi:ParB/RepB/Spo0J family partition protein